MKHRVKILATCRNAELLAATTLVFKSLRIGFPTADVEVYQNATFPDSHCVDELHKVAAGKGINGVVTNTIHHEWIERLLRDEVEPFWICDTDVIFWESIEQWDMTGQVLAGRYTPQFYDRFTNCITLARLHTSLLYIDPKAVRDKVAKYFAQFPETPFNPRPNLIYPGFLPYRMSGTQRNFFHDTCSLLYHAIAGRHFGTLQLDCYDHINYGTISDIVCPHYPGYKWREQHFAVFENPLLAKGCWRAQDAFYENNKA